MKISIGNDHAGVDYQKAIIKKLQAEGHQVNCYGTYTKDSVDYPDFIHPVAADVSNNMADFGIIICGSGNGAAMTANKHQKVRAALCWTKELVVLSRQHNNANILSIPARFVSETDALSFVELFLNTAFEAGRHQGRVIKIACQ